MYLQSGSDWAVFGSTIVVGGLFMLALNWLVPRYGPPKYRKCRGVRMINWTRVQREAERERRRQEGHAGQHEG